MLVSHTTEWLRVYEDEVEHIYLTYLLRKTFVTLEKND